MLSRVLVIGCHDDKATQVAPPCLSGLCSGSEPCWETSVLYEHLYRMLAYIRAEIAGCIDLDRLFYVANNVSSCYPIAHSTPV